MKKRLFLSLLSTTIVVACLLMSFFGWVGYQQLVANSFTAMQNEAALVYLLHQNGTLSKEALAQAGFADRVTLVDAQGKPLFDNYADVAQMDNHLEREEIQQSLAKGESTSVRHSETLTEQLLYYAKHEADGTFVRVARLQAVIWSEFSKALGLLGAVLLVILTVTYYVARKITGKVLEPLRTLKLREDTKTTVYPELKPIVDSFAKQRERLNAEKERFARLQQEIKVITNNMNEGLLLFGEQDEILSLNKSASRFFGLRKQELLGKTMVDLQLPRDVQEFLATAKASGRATMLAQRGDNYYQLSSSRVAGQGLVLLIMDVTARTNAENLRRQFTANVSHELKTPLQSVLGYSEIMLNGLVREADRPRFLQKINDEAHNLLELIDDVMKLSRLDEMKRDMLEEFSLQEVCQKAMEDLSVKAEQQQVTLKYTGAVNAEFLLLGMRSVMQEVVNNLVDNGIKYNVVNGSVTVHLEEREHKYVLNVKDTGVGIPAEEQVHIFERFYRVDTSHNKTIPGTGLGLSLVRHGVIFHEGTIKVISHVGQGTEFVLKFPKREL